MVPVDSRRVSRAPRYSGIRFESGWFSPTRLSRYIAPFSNGLRLTTRLVTLLLRTLQPLLHPKVQQVWAVPISLATTFGIEFLSFPPGTEMVHFPGFARTRLWIHRAVLRFYRSGFPHSDILVSKPAFVSLFFFPAEDGIRDRTVTGVQTCALPIWPGPYPGCGPMPFAKMGNARSSCHL